MDYCKEHIKADCEELLSRFQQSESVRYEHFATIWREMNFPSIFFGKMQGHKMRQFSRQTLATAYTYLLPPYTFQIRVGGLYMIYGLYHSQLSTPREKIWLALKDWEEVKKFQQDAVNAQHFDVAYIFKQLLSEKAFLFTAMPKPLSFQVKKKHSARKHVVCEDFMDRAARPQELVSTDMLEEIANVHDHYERVKAAISATPGQPDPSISLIRKDLVPRLRNTVVGYYNWQKEKGSQGGGDEDSGEGTSNQQECSRRAELLASIKSKSYGQLVEASKARRHRQVESGETTSEAGPAKDTEYQKKRAPSLRQRTRKSLVKGNLKEETLKSTSLWCLSKVEAEKTGDKVKKKRFKW